MPGYQVESSILVDPSEIRQQWLDLQARSECSYFQTWGWIGTWLEQIAAGSGLIAVKILQKDHLCGAGLFVPVNIQRHVFIRSNALFLNEFPFGGNNMAIEYNGLLAERGHEAAVYSEAIGHLREKYRQYDELHFGAVAEGVDLDSIRGAETNGMDCITNEESISWQVDLTAFEAVDDTCLAYIGKNRRSQIRRSMRLYEQQGPLQLIEAENTGQALEFFEGLKILHTERQQSKGNKGSFAKPHWERFHRVIIQTRFNEGEIQLIKISNTRETIGYIYNLVWRKQAYVLQTGFRFSDDKRLMPGYVCHVLAIAHNRVIGNTVYDLMHGDSLYKRLLCNQSRKLYWVMLQRPRSRFRFERRAVKLVRRCRKLLR